MSVHASTRVGGAAAFITRSPTRSGALPWTWLQVPDASWMWGAGPVTCCANSPRSLPSAQIFCGVDAAPRMIEVARSTTTDRRTNFVVGVAEDLPYDDASFDLVMSTTSFDHWRDQKRGLAECVRVLEPEGYLVLADLFSRWLLPTLFGSRRAQARTRKRLTPLLTSIGMRSLKWHQLSTPLIPRSRR
jgi:ubiquinone/menaquinone biosynthesis C-methylase UbiE